MWTRLAYLSLPQGFKAQNVKGQFHSAAISGRYKASLKKEFYIHGVPWIYEDIREDKNPRHKLPKGRKSDLGKVVRIDKIKKLLITNTEAEQTHLQDHLNKRKLKGFDKFLIQGLTPWMKTRDSTNTSEDKIRKSMIATIRGGKGAKQEEEDYDIF